MSKGIHWVSWVMHAINSELFLSPGNCGWYSNGIIGSLQPAPHGHHGGRSPGVACLIGALDERCLATHFFSILSTGFTAHSRCLLPFKHPTPRLPPPCRMIRFETFGGAGLRVSLLRPHLLDKRTTFSSVFSGTATR